MAKNIVVTLYDDNGNPLGSPSGAALTVTSAAAVTLLNQASAAQTASGSSGPLTTTSVSTLAVDVNVTAVTGTTPSMTLILERLGADGNWYSVWTSGAITAAGVTSVNVGPGLPQNAIITGTVRLRWTVTGTTPSFTFSASIVGR